MNYIKEALRTESTTFKVDNERLLHAAMGLSTEIGELVLGHKQDSGRQNIIEEIGDCYWYLALAYDAIGVDSTKRDMGDNMEYIELNIEDIFHELTQVSSDLLDILKKSIFYGRELDEEKILFNLIALETLLGSLAIYSFDIAPEKVMEMNIEKLRKRYPDKFKDVIDRDENHELSHIK